MENSSSPSLRVCEWLINAQNRFRNMEAAGIDMNGHTAIKKAIKNLENTGKLTVGAVIYIWNRSNPEGSVPGYNKHKGYDKKYGNMTEINLQDLIDSDMVQWASGRNAMSPAFVQALAKQTNHEWKLNRLVRKPRVVVGGLFK